MDNSLKNDLMHLVGVYQNNVDYEIKRSSADVETKKLVESVANETSGLLATFANRIAREH